MEAISATADQWSLITGGKQLTQKVVRWLVKRVSQDWKVLLAFFVYYELLSYLLPNNSSLVRIITFCMAAAWGFTNDGPQIFGPLLAAFPKTSFWKIGAYFATVIALYDLRGYLGSNGDPAFGKLDRIALPEQFTIWQLLGPGLLMVFSHYRANVSNGALLLSAVASNLVVQDMLWKSFTGYCLGLLLAFMVAKFVQWALKTERGNLFFGKSVFGWGVALWLISAYTVVKWVGNDSSQMYVYLPRRMEPLPFYLSVAFILVVVMVLCWTKLGNMGQQIIDTPGFRQDTPRVVALRDATLILLVFCLVIEALDFVDSHYVKVSLSTSWLFIGVLAGRLFGHIDRIDGVTRKYALTTAADQFIRSAGGFLAAWIINNPKQVLAFFPR